MQDPLSGRRVTMHGVAALEDAPTRPPWLERCAYRTLAWKLDARYHGWIADDVRSGRALRWRLVTCGVVVAGTQLLVRTAIAGRGAAIAPAAATLGGVVLGLSIGLLLMARQDPEARVARALRYQGVLPDGSPDPNPRWLARLDNHGVAAVQLATLAMAGIFAGYLPARLVPVPEGRCAVPPPAWLSPIRDELRPGVRLRAVRTVRRGGVAYVSATTDSGDAVSWRRLQELGGRMQGTGPAAAAVAPGLGFGGFHGPGAAPSEETGRAAEACSRAAVANGALVPTLLVPTPKVGTELGVLRIRGPADFELAGVSASCNGDTLAVVDTGTLEVGLTVTTPKVFVTLQQPGTTLSFLGRIGAIGSGVVTVRGVLPPLAGQTGGSVEVSGRVPCVDG